MIEISKLKQGDRYRLYQQDLFNKGQYLYRGKCKFISKTKEDILHEDEDGNKYYLDFFRINNGFWKLCEVDED